MTLFRLLTEGTRALEQAGVPDAKEDAKQLLLTAFHLDLVHFLLNRMEQLEENSRNESSIELYRDMIRRRRGRCPLQQILGWQEFMGLEFYVNSHVLIPRQDTETLAEQVLADTDSFGEKSRRGDHKSLLDLCTGSGCIAVSLARKGLFDQVAATDISGEALKVAARNVENLLPGWIVNTGERGEEKQPEKGAGWFWLFQGDLFEALPKDGRRFDVIVSNPPYIPSAVINTLEPEVREHEPVLALDGKEDGLAYYRRIAAEAGDYLKPTGAVYVEIGCDQGEAVRRIFQAAGYKRIQIYQDLPGKDRVVKAWCREEDVLRFTDISEQ